MIDIVEQIHDYLETQGVTDLYIGDAPSSVGECVWIVGEPSPPPNPSIGYFEQFVSFWARYKSTRDAKENLKTIFDLLHRKVSYKTESAHIYLSAANTMIEDMDRDIEDRKLMRIGFRFIYREESNE